MSPRPLQPSDFGLSDDSNRLVLSALSRAFIENLSEFHARVEAAGVLAVRSDAKIHESEVMQLLQDGDRLAQNLKELARWIYRRKALPFEEAVRRAKDFKALGDDWVEQMCTGLQKLSEGAPPRMRRSHIDAFEFMLQSKENTLGTAMLRFCTCGGRHTAKCRQRLKTGVRSLKKVLRKYAPDLVSRYDSLHPDRRPLHPPRGHLQSSDRRYRRW